MTFAACETDTVGSPDVSAAPAVCAALTFGSLPFGSPALDSLAGVEGALLTDGRSANAELGGTRAADGGTEPTDAVSEALVAAGVDEAFDSCVAGLGDAAVDVTDGASEDGGAITRGACDSTFGAGVLAVDGAAGVTEVTTGAVVVCVTGGGGGSTGATGATGATGSTAC